jgi:capsular polysaccharide biosynthesis protein
LYHNLLDNFARLHYLETLCGENNSQSDNISIAIPSVFPNTADMNVLEDAFIQGRKTQKFTQGLYEFERLIIPPLANKNDYMMHDAVQFLVERLSSVVKKTKPTFPTRIYVSRADTRVRNLSNDAELAAELTKLGFLCMCPGEYSIRTQLEIFAGADVVVGLHGMGLMPFLVSQNCKALLEYEALGWPITAFTGMATAVNKIHKFLPCKLLENNRSGMFDWLAEANIPETINIIKTILG